ncbi:hypothetical protein CEXT_41171 [Caerostris extrusa]|uniref:Uncharacterized protein n=1 Tax=Caerostris extrusa TaxID=172846 RepID=A0AAV4QB60_CAEEX|nr:hypothetical protein CEXT_41171 [Caerostris extrusa]
MLPAERPRNNGEIFQGQESCFRSNEEDVRCFGSEGIKPWQKVLWEKSDICNKSGGETFRKDTSSMMT